MFRLPLKRCAVLAFLLIAPAGADKIIMKDGKIYEGYIMGETRRSVLISNPPLDPKPRFVELNQVLTIVRESRTPEKPSLEERRFASVVSGVNGQVHSSRVFSFSPSPGLFFGGAFRIHPFLELGGELHFTPVVSGEGFAVSDGQTIRGYEAFYAYHGGFALKFFPLYRYRERRLAFSNPGFWRAEPYLISGYHWNRLVPKDSGDELRGTSVFGGVGIMVPWRRPCYWDFRVTYDHTNYDSIKFLSSEGSLTGVTDHTVSFQAGLSYRFL